MNRCIIVTGHCDTPEKNELVLKLLTEIRKRFDCKLAFSTHIYPNTDISDIVDYVLYLKENKIENVDWFSERTLEFSLKFNLWDYSKQNLVDTILMKPKPLHGFAHHHIMSSALRMLDYEYDVYHFINYDAHWGALDNVLKFEEYIKDGYDGVFYDFRTEDNRFVNTECYTINEKIKNKIESVKTIEEYYDADHVMCEYVYTKMVEPFKIKRVGPFTGTVDGEIGSIQFRDSMDEQLKPLFPEHPFFISFPYEDPYANKKILLFVPRVSDKRIKIMFVEKQSKKLIAEVTFDRQDPGKVSKIDLPDEVLDSYCEIVDLIEDKIIFKFDLSDKINWGAFIVGDEDPLLKFKP